MISCLLVVREKSQKKRKGNKWKRRIKCFPTENFKAMNNREKDLLHTKYGSYDSVLQMQKHLAPLIVNAKSNHFGMPNI